MAGALPTAARLHKAGSTESDRCPCCDTGERETLEHIFQHCPAHREVRERAFSTDFWEALPKCLTNHGLHPLQWFEHRDFPLTKDAQKGLAAEVQYALLDIWENRLRLAPLEFAPVARW